MDAMLNNLINGNLTLAKKQGKNFSIEAIRSSLIEDYGYSFKKATLTTEWLKGADCYQAACDAE